MSFAVITIDLLLKGCSLLCVLKAFLDFVMTRLKEQRICVMFYFALMKTASETRDMVQTTVDDNAVWSRQAFVRDSRLKCGEISVEVHQPLR